MAARYAIPAFVPSPDPPSVMDKVLPRWPEPVVVGFRNGGDLTRVLDAILANKKVHVDASAGAGKSTLLPRALAHRFGGLVVQVFPNEYLAWDVSQYVAKSGGEVEFLEKVEDEFPETGVACISAPLLVAKWLAAGEAFMPKCIVLHDESHESDAYTYVVREVAVSVRSVVGYVTASATAAPDGHRVAETPGEVTEKLIDPSRFSGDWDVYGGDPWAVDQLRGHLLIYEDSRSKAEDMAQKYRLAGMDAFRLHARMPLREYQFAAKVIRDPASPLVAFVADHVFRSGFTYPVVRTVDTGRVHNVVVQAGKPIRESRCVYAPEAYQAKNRGGRLSGLRTEYYRPDWKLENRICDLEAVEVDVAALVFRLLGYRVPYALASASTLVGDVPRNLPSALRGGAPLATLSAAQKVSFEAFFSVSGRRSPYLRHDVDISMKPEDVMDNSVSADVAAKHGLGGLRRVSPIKTAVAQWEAQAVQAPVQPPFPPLQGKEAISPFDYQEETNKVADTLRAVSQYQDSVDGMTIGVYYYATGLYSDAIDSMAFPDGADSVCRWVSRDLSESAHLGLSEHDRSVAINALLARYNIKTCELRVLARAIPAAKDRVAGIDAGAVRQWATEMTERMVAVVAELRVLSTYVERFVLRFCGLAEMPPVEQVEQAGYQQVFATLGILPKSAVGPPVPMVTAMRNAWGGGQGAVGGCATTVLSDSSGSSDGMERLTSTPMPTVGRGMRALARPAMGVNPRERDKEYSLRKRSGKPLALLRRPSG